MRYRPNKLDLQWARTVKHMSSKDKETCLINAAQKGLIWHSALLVSYGTDIQCRKNGALVEAARNGHTDMVAFFLEIGADVNAENNGNNTESPTPQNTYDHRYSSLKSAALNYALLGGHFKTAEILLQNGANTQDIDFTTYYAISCEGKAHEKKFDLLLDYWEKRHKDLKTTLKLPNNFFDNKTLHDLRQPIGPNGETGFALAAQANCFEKVIDIALKDKSYSVRMFDFICENAVGNRPVDFLADRGKLSVLFNKHVWENRPQKLNFFWHRYVPAKHKRDINIQTLNKDIFNNRHPLRLQRRRPKP